MSIIDKLKSFLGIITEQYNNEIKEEDKKFNECFTLINEKVIVSKGIISYEEEESIENIFTKKDTSKVFKNTSLRFCRKVKFINGDNEYFIIRDKTKILVYFKDKVRSYNLDVIDFEKYSIEYANKYGIVIKDKENKNKIALIRFDSSELIYYEFEEPCFRYLLEANRFIVGTSPGYDELGKLISLINTNEVELAIRFKEIFKSAFGEFASTPNYIETTEDENIIVGNEKVVYAINSRGELLLRFKPTNEVNKKDKSKRSINTVEELSSEIANSVVDGFMSGLIDDNIRKVIFNNNSKYIYIQDGYKDFWAINLLNEVKIHKAFANEIKYFNVTMDEIVVALDNGEVKKFNLFGEELLTIKAPLPIRKVVKLNERYMLITDNGRGYDYSYKDNNFIVGSGVGLELYLMNYKNKYIIYDCSGYIWMTDDDNSIELLEVSLNGANDIAEIGEKQKFQELWKITDIYGDKLINTSHKCIYTMLRDYGKVTISCYSYDKELLWRKNYSANNYNVELSRDGKYIFLAYNDGISYEKGTLIVLDYSGKKVFETKVPAISFKIKYCENNNILFTFKCENEKKYYVYNILRKKQLEEVADESSIKEELGFRMEHFEIVYKDKKLYDFKSQVDTKEVKLSAEVYEAYEIDDKHLLVKIGKRTVAIYNKNLDRVKEYKNDKDIIKIQISDNGAILVSKESIRFIKDFYTIDWEYKIPPKSHINHVTWDKERKLFLIAVGNSEEYLLATINELGEVKKSQIFDDVNYYNGAYFIPEENKVFLYRHVIEAFLIE